MLTTRSRIKIAAALSMIVRAARTIAGSTIEDSTRHLKRLSIGNEEIGVANPTTRSGDLVCGKIDSSFSI
jgi:hypothetical protein